MLMVTEKEGCQSWFAAVAIQNGAFREPQDVLEDQDPVSNILQSNNPGTCFRAKLQLNTALYDLGTRRFPICRVCSCNPHVQEEGHQINLYAIVP